jgi:hypothetical protein
MSEETKTDTKPNSGPPAPKVTSLRFSLISSSHLQEEIICEPLKKESKRNGSKIKFSSQIGHLTPKAIPALSTW